MDADLTGIYRCGACNYKFPGEMAARPGGAFACPKCEAEITRFATYEDGSSFEFVAHTATDHFTFQGDED